MVYHLICEEIYYISYPFSYGVVWIKFCITFQTGSIIYTCKNMNWDKIHNNRFMLQPILPDLSMTCTLIQNVHMYINVCTNLLPTSHGHTINIVLSSEHFPRPIAYRFSVLLKFSARWMNNVHCTYILFPKKVSQLYLWLKCQKL